MMNIRSRLTTVAIVASSIFPVAGLQARAAEPVRAAAATMVKAEDNEMLRTSEDAQKALRDIRAARIAIFNGSGEQAVKLVSQADADLKRARAMEDTLAVQTKKAVPNGGAYVPVDVSLALSEDFVPTPQKESLIQKVDQFLSRKDRKHAIETLKAANVDVTVSALLIPVDASLERVSQAATLLGQQKYYEANLALKAVEDSVVIDSYTTDNIPAQGSKKH